MPIGKMIQYKEMRQHPVLSSYLPETRWISNARTLRMLDEYRTVFIKPNYGSGGDWYYTGQKAGEEV